MALRDSIAAADDNLCAHKSLDIFGRLLALSSLTVQKSYKQRMDECDMMKIACYSILFLYMEN